MASIMCHSCLSKDKIIDELKSLLEIQENKIKSLESALKRSEKHKVRCPKKPQESLLNKNLNSVEICRYGRQIIMPQIGINGQKRLKASSVLIVGAGGLGCPVGLYLCAAGIGTIGIVDYDVVEMNNLHRQVLHTEDNIGIPKVESFIKSLSGINSDTNFVSHKLLLNSKNAKEIVENYDIIIDASDNVPTRYLLNDVACLLNKTLVSGSALRFEGQLTVYNLLDGPCYRCLYPDPPPPSTATNCSDGGIMGAVTGVIGCLQALEVVKIIVNKSSSYVNKLLHFDGEYGEFRVFKLRGKKASCAVCGNSPKITELIDYEFFCNSSATDKEENISLLSDSERISCKEYAKILRTNSSHILLDVRPHLETQICSIPNSTNIPFDKLMSGYNLDNLYSIINEGKCGKVNYVICRRGNDSQRAVEYLKNKMKDVTWLDVKGGLTAWHHEVDGNFPLY